MNLFEAMKNRRTHYDLSATSPISDFRLQEILTDAITYTPSAFHSQSSRAVLLLGKKHTKLWDIVTAELATRVPPERFAPTAKKMQGFSAAYGTILFFEDEDTVVKLQNSFAQYADNFPVWSNQSAGMLQYAVWTALSVEGLGASLQHYNPIIDAAVQKEFDIPASWALKAQMPFGTSNSAARKIEYLPIHQRFKVLGGEKND